MVGLACGASCVAAPMYVNEMAPENLRNQIGVFFQISVTLGIALVAAIGLALAPQDFSVDLKMELRFQIVLCISVLIAAIVIPIAVAIPESTKWFPPGHKADDDEAVKIALQAEAVEVQDFDRSSWKQNAVPLGAAIAMSVAAQLTGINAIMNYAPKITKAAGMTPLVGNFVVMLWNFVTTLVSIPLAKRFPLRRMYLTATLIASLACLCTGIPVYPGVVANDSVKHVLAGIGILVFIAAYEFGIGPPYFVLAQQLFPRSFRGTGSSFTLVVNNTFNVIINVCFPIAVVGLSGGKNGDQDKGMGIVFMAFGTMGALSWLVLVKTLRPSPDA